MRTTPRTVPWLAPGEKFPPLASAWGPQDPAPGLLAAGGQLDVPTLLEAYRLGIFPWFSPGQPPLWWSPDPRMVLPTAQLKVRRSLRQTLQRFRQDAQCEIRFDSAFDQVIAHCAATPRAGQDGTWIVPAMQQAYGDLHRAGHAHSVETWVAGQLVGGLYAVNLGRMVFGESMFSHATDASKIALAALVAFCRVHGIGLIDCQQNTRHLAFLGAHEISRAALQVHLEKTLHQSAPQWHFETLYWQQLF